jgi:beta-glucanase (GH16 family)
MRASHFAVHLAAAALLLATPLFSASYHLTFDDEFNSYNSNRWQTADFWGIRNNGGDFQGQWFCDPNYAPRGYTAYNPFSFSNGVLTISAQPTPATNTYAGAPTPNARPQPYVSGQLTTAHKFTQRYGYYELRAKLPPGKGLWSRYWLLTDDGGWPGEYDVFEVLGKEKPVKVHQTTHYRDASKPHGIDGFTYAGIVPTDGKFHTYGFLWEPKTVTWYVDGVATLKQVNRINMPMYVLLDLAVGKDPANTWPGSPDGTTPWPANMEMDYFRVYSNDPSLPSVTPDEGYQPSTLPDGNTVETTPTTAKLPAGWTSGDIGSPDVKGSSAWNPITGEWMLKGTGFGIGGYGDQCQFAGAPLSGDGGVMATVQTATAINSDDVKAGVMIRESTGQSAREIALLYSVSLSNKTLTNRLTFQSRSGTGGATTSLVTVPNISAPVTLRLMRSGNTFTGAYSTNGGLNWMAVGTPQSIAMGGTVQAGLAVGGNQSNYRRLARATFNNVTIVK